MSGANKKKGLKQGTQIAIILALLAVLLTGAFVLIGQSIREQNNKSIEYELTMNAPETTLEITQDNAFYLKWDVDDKNTAEWLSLEFYNGEDQSNLVKKMVVPYKNGHIKLNGFTNGNWVAKIAYCDWNQEDESYHNISKTDNKTFQINSLEI